MKRLVVFLLVTVVLFYAECVLAAGLEVSLSGGNPSVSLGPSGEWTSTESTSARCPTCPITWIITGSSNGYETINIKVGASGWSTSEKALDMYAVPGINKYVIRKDSSTGMILLATDQVLFQSDCDSPLPSNFGLYFKAPTTGTADASKAITVTLTASAWVATCQGWCYADKCWHTGALGQSRDTICSAYGGFLPASSTQAEQVALCAHFYPTKALYLRTCCYGMNPCYRLDLNKCDYGASYVLEAGTVVNANNAYITTCQY